MKKIFFLLITSLVMLVASENLNERSFAINAFQVNYQRGDDIVIYTQYPKTSKVIFKNEEIVKTKLLDDYYYDVNVTSLPLILSNGSKNNVLEIELSEDQGYDPTLLSVYTASGKLFKLRLHPLKSTNQKVKPDLLVEVKSTRYDEKRRSYRMWNSNKR